MRLGLGLELKQDGGASTAPNVPTTPPTPLPTIAYFGQSAEPDASLVVFLTGFDFQDISIGPQFDITISPLAQGEFIYFFVPTQFEIDTLNQAVGSGVVVPVLANFAKTENIQTIGTRTYDSYRRGPISQAANGLSISYQATFIAGS